MTIRGCGWFFISMSKLCDKLHLMTSQEQLNKAAEKWYRITKVEAATATYAQKQRAVEALDKAVERWLKETAK